ncbi:MAG: hypothetical protein QXX08_02450, partial [Candidatus Bathyarchaeia archaeon]
ENEETVSETSKTTQIQRQTVAIGCIRMLKLTPPRFCRYKCFAGRISAASINAKNFMGTHIFFNKCFLLN